MKTIAFLNLKGGVGKTVSTANVADILAANHDKRILLIDADGQGNLSQFFGVKPEEGQTTLDLLESGAGYYPDFVTPTEYEHIDIIPADASLMYADVDALNDGRAHLQSIVDLRDAIEADNSESAKAGVPGDYDYIMIDCPPAFSAASTAALAAADEVIIPIKLDAFSSEGMVTLTQQVANMRRINDRIRIAGCLVTMWQETDLAKEALKFLRSNPKIPVFRTTVRWSKRVSDSTFARQPLRTFSPGSAATRDYRKFVEELLEGGRNNG